MIKTNKHFGIVVLVLLITLFACNTSPPTSKSISYIMVDRKSNTGVGASAPSSSVKESPASDFSYDLTEDGRGVKIVGYIGKGGDVVIPLKIEDMLVLEIGEWSFAGLSKPPNVKKLTNRNAITSIIIPNSVEKIGTQAFFYG